MTHQRASREIDTAELSHWAHGPGLVHFPLAAQHGHPQDCDQDFTFGMSFPVLSDETAWPKGSITERSVWRRR